MPSPKLSRLLHDCALSYAGEEEKEGPAALEAESLAHPLIAPINCGNLAGLPPILLQVCGEGVGVVGCWCL